MKPMTYQYIFHYTPMMWVYCHGFATFLHQVMGSLVPYVRTYTHIYEGRSINKFQNGTFPSILKIGKIRDIGFVGNLILNIHTTFLSDDVIIVMSSDNRTQSICVLFSSSVYYRNLQVINSIRTIEKKRKSLMH